ncbi:MAG TPA: transposase [Gemmatimonadaceae bacterium]|nr:transposase [Gemmatimonadaceae bacterium]
MTIIVRVITRSSRRVLARKPVQLELSMKRDKNGQRRGGARPGAGRPRKPKGTASEWHKRRADVNHRHPQHVTLRVLGEVGHLRKRFIWRAIRTALLRTAERADFRIVHMSVQGNHIHLICEADSKAALTAGVWGFEISAAKHINGELGGDGRRRKGQVFADRYHVVAMSSLRQTRHCVSYVLNNWRHHKGERGPSLYGGKIDPYSSGVWFPFWKERTTPDIHVPAGYDPPPVCRPMTWLLTEGLKRAAPISVWEVPR